MAQMDDNNNDEQHIRNRNESLLSLIGCKEWLEQQNLDYEAELNRKTCELCNVRLCEVLEYKTTDEEVRTANQKKLEGRGELNMEQLCESIFQLQEKLLEVSSTHSTKQYVLEKLLSSYVKMKKLFSTTDTKTGDSEPNNEEFFSQINEQQILSKDILKYQEALQEEQITLKDVERELIEATKTNEKLSVQFQIRAKQFETKQRANKSKRQAKEELSLRKQILKRQDTIEVARNICQALIFGSDVEWSEDEELRKMVLNFGKPFNLLET